MWGWKEDGDAGGREEEDEGAAGNVYAIPSPPPVDSEARATVRELTNCQSADQG